MIVYSRGWWVGLAALAMVALAGPSGADDGSAAARGQRAEVYVAVSGRDDAPGTRQQPFRTIQRARDAVRQLKARVRERDLVVEIAGGDYFLTEPLVFDERDSGVGSHRVIYRSRAGQTARLIGGRRVGAWEKAGDNLWRTRIMQGDAPSQLFEDDVRAQMTRYPERSYFHTAGVKHPEAPRRTFSYKPEDIPDSLDLDQARVYIWAGQDWFTDFHPIARCDRAAHTIALTADTNAPDLQAAAARRYCLYNVRAPLGRPGRFFTDYAAGYICYTPRQTPIERQEIIVPTLTQIVELRGGSAQAPVRNVVLDGLKLDISAFGDSFCETQDGDTVTPWNEPANRKGAVYFENAVGCVVRNCEIVNAGYCAVCLNRFAQDNVIRGNLIRDAGYHGVLLGGYNARTGRDTDYNRRNHIADNWIHHCGRLVGQGAGIFGYGSGANHLDHNLIHDMPRYGICFKGQSYHGKQGFHDQVIAGQSVTFENHWDFQHARDNVIEFNEIHHVNQDSEDSGAISFKASGKGNIVHNNLIHDCPRDPDSRLGAERIAAVSYVLNQGIYLDDESDYFTVTHNLVYNLNGGWDNLGYLIYAKGVGNVITDNVLIGDELTDFGIGLGQDSEAPLYGHVLARNIIRIRNPEGTPFRIHNYHGDRTPDQQIAFCDDNVYWTDAAPCRIQTQTGIVPFAEWRALYGGKYDQHTVVADPQFVDAARNDYRLQADSPAFKLGFQAIDMAGVGPRSNPFLANQPGGTADAQGGRFGPS